MDGIDSERISSRQEAADYISAIAGELARLAGTHELSVLKYLLDMARQEAHTVVLSEGGDASLAGK